ncbi:LexA family protein [Virgisporangium aurantiacum]|uniref:LexA family protein n=1 Tax=Virgisporangium aurantiacum TaxID=175570 RepID=UPI00357155C4
MIDGAICDGDTVFHQQPIAESGDVVAAMLDGEATVKVYRRTRNGCTEPAPRNPEYRPIPRPRHHPRQRRLRPVAP